MAGSHPLNCNFFLFSSLTPLASKAHRQKTSIKKRTLNPEFNSVLQFIVPFKDLPKKTLEIGVYDYDVGRHDDYIGRHASCIHYCRLVFLADGAGEVGSRITRPYHFQAASYSRRRRKTCAVSSGVTAFRIPAKRSSIGIDWSWTLDTHIHRQTHKHNLPAASGHPPPI